MTAAQFVLAIVAPRFAAAHGPTVHAEGDQHDRKQADGVRSEC
jgi:hypothetical protein